MKRLIPAAIAVLAVVACGAAQPAPYRTVVVESVVDGDTFKLRDTGGVRFTARVLGIDSPETKDPRKPVQCWGPEATAFAKATLENQVARLVEDRTQAEKDRYGRTLGYLVLPSGDNFSVLAARAGAAKSYVFNRRPVAEHVAIEAAEREARAAGRGLWSCR